MPLGRSLTTDLRQKSIAFQERIGGRLISIGGMAKGSGMIHPRHGHDAGLFHRGRLDHEERPPTGDQPGGQRVI